MPPKQSTKQPVKLGQASRKKTAQKQPLPVTDRLKRLFTSLCAQIDGGHFANAVKTCDKILRLDPQDKDALQTKLFLLLQTDQYAAALALIGDVDSFEKAYSFYRTHREAETTAVMTTIKASDEEENRGVAHLEAQLAYRQGSYQTAVDLYTQLLDTAEPDSEEQSDLLTNLEAAQKHLDFINSGYLRALDALPTSITGSLQTAPPPAPPPTASARAGAQAVAAADIGTADKPKKVRARRVPKGVVPGVTPAPDPERWLKKSERSTFGQGRRRKGGGGATQGAVETPGSTGGKGAGGGKGKKKK